MKKIPNGWYVSDVFLIENYDLLCRISMSKKMPTGIEDK
jgi:hypothetical protein